jgi:trehalose-phosphatase
MNEPSPTLSRLWAQAVAARHLLLMLDYDGTLAPFKTDRAAAVPSRRMLDLLEDISRSGRTRIAIISGRPVEELARFLEDLPARMVGEHGWEVRLIDRRVIRYPLPAVCRSALEEALSAVAGEPWAGRIEAKRTSLMLHTRGLSLDDARRIESDCTRLWTPSILEGRLRLCPVNGGIELRAPGRHKGTAVRELMAEAPPQTLSVYAGDDETDEDAFRAVGAEGYGLLVSPERRRSHASERLPSIDAMTDFLQTWLTLVEQNDRPPPSAGGTA